MLIRQLILQLRNQAYELMATWFLSGFFSVYKQKPLALEGNARGFNCQSHIFSILDVSHS